MSELENNGMTMDEEITVESLWNLKGDIDAIVASLLEVIKQERVSHEFRAQLANWRISVNTAMERLQS